MPGSRDITLLSLGTTPGLRRADAAFAGAAAAAGVSCEVLHVPIGAAGKLRRQITVTDTVEALAARRAVRSAHAQVVVFSTVTVALLARARGPYAIRFDSPAALNRPGLAGAWQRWRERSVMEGAAVLLPWGEAAAGAVPPGSTPVVPLHVPVDVQPGDSERDIDAIAYAGYPEKRGLDVLMQAWAAAGGGRLVIAGVERDRAESWLRERGVPVPDGVEWPGLLERGEWEGLLQRARVFVNASRREDHGLSQLEGLAAGCVLVTVPSSGPYEALPIARRLEPRFVARPESLGEALALALGEANGGYAERARAELEPYRRESVQRVFEDQVLPALGLR